MASVIKKTPNEHGVYRYIKNVDLDHYPESEWLHDPDLSSVASVSMKYWSVGGTPPEVREMRQAEKDVVNMDIADQSNSVIGMLVFEKGGRCRNKWVGMGSSKTSNNTPFIIPAAVQVTSLTFVNNVNSVETDIEIYRNGKKVYTWEIRDKRWAWKTQGLSDLSFITGDRISMFLRDRGTDPTSVIVTIHYTMWSREVGEGGASTL